MIRPNQVNYTPHVIAHQIYPPQQSVKNNINNLIPIEGHPLVQNLIGNYEFKNT